MKRPWTTYLILASIIGLLTLFLGLQYNWLLQASLAERERMDRRVDEDAKRFAEDFNREIQAAYFNFQADPEGILAGDATEMAERYEYWKRNTDFPDLIKEIDYIPNSPQPIGLRFGIEERRFEPIEIQGQLLNISNRIKAEKHPPAIVENESALIVPLRSPEKRVERIMLRRSAVMEAPMVDIPQAIGYVIVLLDSNVVKEKMLPTIAAKHFQPNEYNVSVTDRTGNAVFQTAAVSQSPDTKAQLFDLTPNNLIFFSNGEMLQRKMGEPKAGTVFNQRVESHTLTTKRDFTTKGDFTTERGEMFKIEMKEDGGHQRSAVVTSTTGGNDLWTLNVQHTAGSIDAFIRDERNRSFLIGLGVYVLLVSGILAIVISAMRSRVFAQRQIDFVSSVSHEFRTPLAVIYSAGENLADGVAKDETQVSRYGNLIKGEGKKLSGMVEQILEFAGARSGKKKYNFAPTRIAEVVENALAECEPELTSRDFKVEKNVADGLPFLNTDAEAITSAIKNLIQNSVKYSDGSHWIRVAAENGNGRIKVSVEDRGIGISSSEQKQIFEPFFRSKQVVDAQIHGNGLGLSLVKEIAEAHGGTVIVESQSGKGSKFTIELPQSK